MGKNTHEDEQPQQQQQEGGGDRLSSSLGNHGPSCMWGILHHFQHNRWLHAKKLKHHHHHHHHHPDQEGSTKTGSDDSTAVVETTKAKNSMKSRLKSLITEEIMSKKKGGGRRHQRSTSHPTRAPPDDHSTTPDPSLPDTTTPPPCEMCTTMLDLNYNNNNNNNMASPTRPPRQVPVRDHHHRDSIQESKLFMNALDLLNLRKEVFLKILHDPNSSLAHQLHHHRTNNSNALSLSKSVSFPASSSSSSPLPDSENITDPTMELELPDINNNKKHTTDHNHHHHSNNSKIVVLKRFKNLREKIKHVIRDRKKEKNRIIMDAVHHKIPFGGEHKNNNNNNNKFGKPQRGHHNRTSSLDESYTRYTRLLDTITSDTPAYPYANTNANANANVKYHAPTTTSSPKPPVFQRILSLPDLRAYSSIHDNDDNDSATTTDNIKVVDPSRASQDNLFDVGSTFDESVDDSKTWETASSNDLINPPPPQTDEYDGDDDEIGGTDSSELLIPMNHRENMEIEKLYKELLQLHAGTENEAEFNYVKDVLEMSGFTRDELLGEWHSAERPLDPSMYDEVEGDHLLLFDLINEVLLNIHDRSFCYWPVPLTVRSRIQEMPRGYRVLEEVWAEISWLLSWTPDVDRTIDDVVSRDLEKHDRWMSLQMDAEFVGLEVEDMIFDDLLDEIIVSI